MGTRESSSTGTLKSDFSTKFKRRLKLAGQPSPFNCWTAAAPSLGRSHLSPSPPASPSAAPPRDQDLLRAEVPVFHPLLLVSPNFRNTASSSAISVAFKNWRRGGKGEIYPVDSCSLFQKHPVRVCYVRAPCWSWGQVDEMTASRWESTVAQRGQWSGFKSQLRYLLRCQASHFPEPLLAPSVKGNVRTGFACSVCSEMK